MYLLVVAFSARFTTIFSSLLSFIAVNSKNIVALNCSTLLNWKLQEYIHIKSKIHSFQQIAF
jgi:hypothetical protein